MDFQDISKLDEVSWSWNKFVGEGTFRATWEKFINLTTSPKSGDEGRVYKRSELFPIQFTPRSIYENEVGSHGSVVTWGLQDPGEYSRQTRKNIAPGINSELLRWFAGLKDEPIAYRDVFLPGEIQSAPIKQFLLRPLEGQSGKYSIEDQGVVTWVNDNDVLPIGASVEKQKIGGFIFQGQLYTVISVAQKKDPDDITYTVWAVDSGALISFRPSSRDIHGKISDQLQQKWRE